MMRFIFFNFFLNNFDTLSPFLPDIGGCETLICRKSLQYYRPVARELKRLEPLARSPVYAEQQAAASGVTTIRQLGLGDVMAVAWQLSF